MPKLFQQPLDSVKTISIYDFEFIGDTLELHSHPEPISHYALVTNGVMMMFDDKGDIKKMVPGNLEKIPINMMHGFRSLTPKSRLVNIQYEVDSQ